MRNGAGNRTRATSASKYAWASSVLVIAAA